MSTRKTKKSTDPWRRTCQRFERWRRTRRSGARIPKTLWSAAVHMAQAVGVAQTAKTLRLDYYSLQERVAGAATSAPTWDTGPLSAFLELPAPGTASRCTCTLELEDDAGVRLRVQLHDGPAPDLAALTRSFRGSES
jgi:hypothetical protein